MASDPATRFHETWLGMAQPIEGLVVSIPVLVEAQCLERQPPSVQLELLELCPPVDPRDPDGPRGIRDLAELFSRLLDLTPDLFDAGEALPEELSLWVPEGRQTLRPTMALRKLPSPAGRNGGDEAAGDEAATPAGRAGAPYVALVWELPDGLPLDKPEAATGPWEYPPAAKFDRLLRHCRVPIGLLTNRRAVRLVYAPHGESTGALTFRLDDLATPGGRPLLDAFVMLLAASRFFGVARERQLPALLAQSRKRQADVTKDLATQVMEALETLLRGFEAAAERDGDGQLQDALRRENDHLYAGLLTVLLRLVFLLYAEDRGLLPVEHEHYARHLSVFGLFDQLQQDHGAFPDSQDRRFGAWGRLITLFRAVYLGVQHGDLHLSPRRGQLFNPQVYPFLEGWRHGGGAPISQPESRAAVRVPSVDDATVFRVLEKLIVFEGQRLSYRALDVEQIGSVYEALMGYHVVRVHSPAVCLGPDRFWVEVRELLERRPARRAKWLQEQTGLTKARAGQIAKAVTAADDEPAALAVLEAARVRGTEAALPSRLVIQPGAERRRTSSHYTPRHLSAPIVRRTLEPLLAALGPEPASEAILDLKICDPAMGSGAFLVEACRFLADRLVAAWTREGKLSKVASAHEDVVNHARRLVAQRCLYGVDKNELAVHLAKLSLWLVTLAEDLPFTFLDHALRHGDSLVGLDFDQIRSFHWAPEQQATLASRELDAALVEAIGLRQRILELAEEDSAEAQREKEWLLKDAEDALGHVRLLGDLVVGAFFAAGGKKEREQELGRRLVQVNEWLAEGGAPPPELLAMQDEIRGRLPVFHWMAEFPEVFQAGRRDPLARQTQGGAAYLDAFVGNPPFLGGKRISTELGSAYSDWLAMLHQAGKNGDLSAHFFRRAAVLLGEHGTIGLIATNTIAQGETRAAGLQRLVGEGLEIYEATRSLSWPGEAAVSVSVVHLAKGSVRTSVPRPFHLDGAQEEVINSRLRPKLERPDPVPLAANSGLSFVGSFVNGMGFVLTPEEREELVARDERNAERIFPYIGGDEVNSSPTQTFHRYVISFGDMPLQQAEQWPELLQIVREKVKPDRDRVKRAAHRKYWWHYGDKRPALYEAVAQLERCLVTSIHSKRLLFSFQPTDRIFSHGLYVFSSSAFGVFAVLQSRLHEPWAWTLSSSLEDRLRYTATDCFETFPFPRRDPREEVPQLKQVGRRLYEARAAYMVETQQGLTDTYNRLKDPTCDDRRIEDLRHLHEDLDRAVLTAYGWDDLPVPPYRDPQSKAEKLAHAAFEDEILDRLFILNLERAEEERVQGLAGGRGRKKGGRKKKGRAKGEEDGGEGGQLRLV